MPHAHLPQRGLIAISGEDALYFLQGLVSNDVMRTQKGMSVYAAMLSPQGKFQHDFFLYPWQGGILFDTEKARVPELLQRLKMYKLRSKVTIEPVENLAVTAIWNEPEDTKHEGLGAFPDPRLPSLGWRVISDHIISHPAIAVGDYDQMRLELGVPDEHDMIADKSLLLEFGFEDLHGVDFNKGCYVGQEVTACSKHRGQVRKFIYQVRGDEPLPPPGTAVTLGEAPAGEMRSSLGNVGLAVLRVAETEKAQKNNIDLLAGNVALKASLPSWVIHAPVTEQ